MEHTQVIAYCQFDTSAQGTIANSVTQYMQNGWEPVGTFGVKYDNEFMYFTQDLIRGEQPVKRPQAEFRLICVYAYRQSERYSAQTQFYQEIENYKEAGYMPVGEQATGQSGEALLFFQGMKR